MSPDQGAGELTSRPQGNTSTPMAALYPQDPIIRVDMEKRHTECGERWVGGIRTNKGMPSKGTNDLCPLYML